MDINYDRDLSKTRTCFRKNTIVFRKKHVRVFLKLVINHLQNGNSYRTYCKINSLKMKRTFI